MEARRLFVGRLLQFIKGIEFMAHNLKSIREKFKANGVFYSDTAMAELLKSLVPADAKEVYDPTCGDGNLLAVFADNVRKYGQELDEGQARIAAERLVNAEIAVGDTLTNPAFIDKRFKAIVANPPFSVKWEQKESVIFHDAPCLPPASRADYAFLLHIVHCLADDGVAAVVNFPGVCYRGQREGKLREWLIKRNFIDKVIAIEPGHFVDTGIATVVLVLKKQRASTSILMRDNALDIEREVALKEIEDNDYSLNVSSYVRQPEPVRDPVDPIELENKARRHALKRLRAEIQFSLAVAQMEGWSIEPFLDDIHAVINEFRLQPTLF